MFTPYPRNIKKFQATKPNDKLLEMIQFFKTSPHKFLIDGASFGECPVGFLFYYDDSDFSVFEISKDEYQELSKQYEFKIVPFIQKSYCYYGE